MDPREHPDNPAGTDGFEFVEYTAPDVGELHLLFTAMGFAAVARHRSKDVTLWRQGGINFIVNAEPDSLAQRFAAQHGPSICAMAFRVQDAARALARATALGAVPVKGTVGPMELNIPAIEGIGGSLLYLVDRYRSPNIYDIDFVRVPGTAEPHPAGAGLTGIDHLTHNVRQGRMDHWYGFYHRIFNFREIRYFDIEGQVTSLRSRALTAPCGRIRIPINESGGGGQTDQIEEYLQAYHGEGIQHVALASDDIVASHDRLRANGVRFQSPPPDAYYEMLEQRLPGHGQDVAALQRRGILLDGAGEGKLLLQIFTETVIGPIFFEIIQRKGDEGFGEGNFKALFESIERDQIRRGVIRAA